MLQEYIIELFDFVFDMPILSATVMISFMLGSRPLPFMQVACSPPIELLRVRSYAGESFHFLRFTS